MESIWQIHDPYILQLRRAYLKNCILWNFAFYSFCWRLGFQLLDKNLVTLGLLNILNGFNIAHPCPMYTGKKNSNFQFEKLYFAKFHILQFFQIYLELVEIIHKTVKTTKVLRENVVIAVFKKVHFAKFYMLLILLESWFSVLRRRLHIFTTAFSMT